MHPKVAIIGGGWAGLACAVHLVRHGARVTIFEAARTLGGRARSVNIDGRTLDNGQHILIGAYRETLTLMQSLGVDLDQHLLRMPLTLQIPGALSLRAPALPAPWHGLAAIIGARGLGVIEKGAAIRLMRYLSRRRFEIDPAPVSRLLADTSQPRRVVDLIWEPLCVAALNTPTDIACARTFARVLRDTLTGERHHSDMLLPKSDLTALLPAPASAWLREAGAKICTGHRVTQLHTTDPGWTLTTHDGSHHRFEHVVISTAPHHAARLLEALPPARAAADTIARLNHQPILTAYLHYPPSTRLPTPMIGVANGTAQWLFDRGQLVGDPGLIAALISARGRHLEWDTAQLIEAIHRDIARITGPLPAPHWQQIITEKRATFSCTPEAIRPDIGGGIPGLWLCGDYLDPDYPATLESATRCAIRVARAIMLNAGVDA